MRRLLAPIAALLLVLTALAVAPPAVAQTAVRVVATCGTVSPAYTAGQFNYLTVDVNGNLCGVTGGGGGSVTQGTTPWVDNVTQFGGANVVTGTGAGGAGIPRVTVSNDSVITVTNAGTFAVQNTASTPAGTNNIGTVNGSTVGGYEFNATVIPTVQNASYAAGQSIGGLQTMSIGTTNGLSGILTGIQIASKGGSTSATAVYVWSKNPTNTTCTDKTNFVASQTDNEFLVIGPQAITPALAVTAQDTITYGSATGLVGNFVNGSANTNLYVCVLANATQTPASTTDLRINIQGIKDQP